MLHTHASSAARSASMVPRRGGIGFAGILDRHRMGGIECAVLTNDGGTFQLRQARQPNTRAPPAACDPGAGGRGAGGAEPRIRGAVFRERPPFDTARAGVARFAAASVPLDPLGTPAHGTAELHLLFRWFVGLSVDDPVWVPTGVQQ